MALLYLMQFFILSVCVNLFSVFVYLFYHGQEIRSTFSNSFEREYDYIIVGSGTAGSVIADRMASETNYTFTVVEAGSRSNFLFEIPPLGPMLHGSAYDWQYQTVPQENACLAMNNKRCRLPQGRIVGGSSKLNNMIHVRGNISHYVDWFHGIHTEEYITQQFQFIESNILHLSNIQYESELANAILEAAEELGYGKIGEFNKGFRKSKVSQRDGKRWATSDSLDVSKHVLTNAFVEKVIFKNKVAVGVNVILADKKYEIHAKKGVILSAGTFGTPKILQLSGVGPTELLKSLNIPIINDLPVGHNLQDHVASGLDLIVFNRSLSLNAMNMLNVFHVYEYFVKGKGPLTTPGCEVIGFLSTTGDEKLDLQFMAMPVGISADRGTHLRKTLGINDTAWATYFAKTFDKHTATVLPIVLHPKSKGIVYINSTDPKVPPCIDPKFLSNINDVRTLINGLKLVAKFVETSSMAKLSAYMNPIAFPGCEEYTIFTDAYWECYVRHLTLTSYHPVGTCSMGLSPLNSVVDRTFRVFGLSKLFVADASVLPTIPSGNINAAVAMMASIFFETNVKARVSSKNDLFCDKQDYIREYLYLVCIHTERYILNGA